ncbi:MAG TPA: efflux RND transporter periplasmic adaptor subunit, partial [Thermoanaerobaculia bacterium]
MRIRAVLLLSTLPLLAIGCSGGGKADGPPGDKAKAGAQPAVPVVVSTVARKTVPVQVEAVGKVEPLSTVAVLARVGGELTGVHFTEGQEVQKGQVLFTLDPRPYQAALAQARAAVARDKAVAANSASDLKRYGDLVQKEYVTREQYDRIAAETASAGATVNADEAAVEAARLQLEYCTIRSPLSGRTGSLLVHQGNLVKANDAQPLVVINQIRPIYVSFSVPQAQLPEIERYRSAGRLTVEAVSAEGGGTPQEGALSFIDNQIDRATGTILLKATFPNESRTLWPGQFTKVRLTLARQADAVVVPTQAVQTGQQGQYVYVVRPDQTVEPRTVQVS